MKFSDFAAMAKRAGLVAFDRGNGHWQVMGPNIVNFYPQTRRGPRMYVAGTTGGQYAVAEKAIEAALKPPDVAPQHKKAHRRRRGYRGLKARMLKADPTCFWCRVPLRLDTAITGYRVATIDHRIPLHRGGLDNANNRVLACLDCNRRRGHDMPELGKEVTQ